jgi:hypothetical protein
MEAHKQVRIHQEDVRLTRLANTSLSRENGSIRTQLDSLQVTLDRVLGEKEELRQQVITRDAGNLDPISPVFRFQIDERETQFSSIRQLLQSERDSCAQLQDEVAGAYSAVDWRS